MKCKAYTKKGRRCRHKFADDRDYCFVHAPENFQEKIDHCSFFDIDKFNLLMILVLVCVMFNECYINKDGIQTSTSSYLILSPNIDNFTDCWG